MKPGGNRAERASAALAGREVMSASLSTVTIAALDSQAKARSLATGRTYTWCLGEAIDDAVRIAVASGAWRA